MKVLDQASGNGWNIYRADCVEFVAGMPSNSIDLSVYSPPFANLYIYSESERDMGNVASHAEFVESYRHLVREKFRVTKPGRLSCIHVKDLVYYSNSSAKGDRGLYAFSDDCLRVHVEEGWTFHQRITIPRDPVLEMQKTKADRLLYKHLRLDAGRSGGGLPEYILVFRKWSHGMDEVPPITHDPKEFPVDLWQQWAESVWPNTRETDVLNVGKSDEERHLCPMPLDLIMRCVLMWSNPGEVVFSPFAGIGSEGYQSIRYGRRFIGTELSDKYFPLAAANLRIAQTDRVAGDLLGAEVAA